jgi:hypothetical protein
MFFINGVTLLGIKIYTCEPELDKSPGVGGIDTTLTMIHFRITQTPRSPFPIIHFYDE